MASKANFSGLRFRSLLLLILSLCYLVVVISACASPTSTTTPASDQDKSPPPAVVEVEETPKGTLAENNAENGRALFISKACSGCHTLQGIPEAQGKVGPELTHQASNPMIAGVLPNTEENLKKFLKNPSAVKPGALMPNQGLTDSEIDALVTFLRTLKGSEGSD